MPLCCLQKRGSVDNTFGAIAKLSTGSTTVCHRQFKNSISGKTSRIYYRICNTDVRNLRTNSNKIFTLIDSYIFFAEVILENDDV